MLERFRICAEACAQRCLGLQAVLAVGEQEAVRRCLVERGAMTDRGEHVEQRLVCGGGVHRRGARHYGDAGVPRHVRALRGDPRVGGMQVMREQDGNAIDAEALAQPLCISHGGTAIATHQRVDERRVRSAGKCNAAREIRDVDARPLALGQQGGRRDAGPAVGKRARGGSQRVGPFGRRDGGALLSTTPGRRLRGSGPLASVLQCGDAYPRLALDARELGRAHRPAQLPVPVPVAGEQPQAGAARKLQLGPDEGMNAGGGRRLDELHRAVEAAPVAESDGLDLQLGSHPGDPPRRGSPF